MYAIRNLETSVNLDNRYTSEAEAAAEMHDMVADNAIDPGSYIVVMVVDAGQ